MISGYCGSGKDLAADYLVKTHNFTKMAIANELKLLVAKKYNIDHNLTLTQAGKKIVIDFPIFGKKTIRELLIEEAVFQKQRMGPNIFINHLIDKIKINDVIYRDTHQENIVISDFRYTNEFEQVYNMFNIAKYRINETNGESAKVITIKLNRFDEPPINDISETQLDNFKFDFVIDNKKSIDDLYYNLDGIMYIV